VPCQSLPARSLLPHPLTSRSLRASSTIPQVFHQRNLRFHGIASPARTFLKQDSTGRFPFMLSWIMLTALRVSISLCADDRIRGISFFSGKSTPLGRVASTMTTASPNHPENSDLGRSFDVFYPVSPRNHGPLHFPPFKTSTSSSTTMASFRLGISVEAAPISQPSVSAAAPSSLS